MRAGVAALECFSVGGKKWERDFCGNLPDMFFSIGRGSGRRSFAVFVRKMAWGEVTRFPVLGESLKDLVHLHDP